MYWWSMALYISEWMIRLVMLFVVIRRRRPSSALAWLAVIFFVPWVGLLLYLLIGRNRLPYLRIRKHARLQEKLRIFQDRFRRHPNIVRPQLNPDVMSAVKLAERLGHMPILGGNDVELIADTDEVIDRIIADIDAAEHHVHLLFYIYGNDETGRRVSAALVRAARRGVTCRVLLDAVGSRTTLKTLGKDLSVHGVQVHAALPVGLFRRKMARIDLRTHRKIVVIDGSIGYTGSQNIINASYNHKNLVWRDLMVRITGPVTLELQDVFVGDWYYDADEMLDDEAGLFPAVPSAGTVAAQTLPSGPNYPTENYQRLVVDTLHAASQRVIITTPYFVPDEAFLQAVQTAILRGVRVDLVVPKKSDMKMVDAAGRAYYDDLLEMGANVHLYAEGLLHTKAMSVDGEIAFIGSSNFDIRSFALNFEINMIFYGPEITQQLFDEQMRCIGQSVQITAEQWRARPTSRKLFQNIAKLFSPVL